MKIDVNEHGDIRLEEVYNVIEIKTTESSYWVAERDGFLEIHKDGLKAVIDFHSVDCHCTSCMPTVGQV